jgi:hypothetical protein
MSNAQAVVHLKTARDALKDSPPDTDFAATQCQQAIASLQQDPGPPTADEWIGFIRAIIRMIDEAIAEIDAIIQAINDVLEAMQESI